MNGLSLREQLMTTMSVLAYVALVPVGAKAESSSNVLPASMAGIADRTGAAERVETADFMIALTQESASAACHLHNGIAAEQSKKLLNDAHDDFAQ